MTKIPQQIRNEVEKEIKLYESEDYQKGHTQEGLEVLFDEIELLKAQLSILTEYDKIGICKGMVGSK